MRLRRMNQLSSIWSDDVPYLGTMCPKFDATQQSGRFSIVQALMVDSEGDQNTQDYGPKVRIRSAFRLVLGWMQGLREGGELLVLRLGRQGLMELGVVDD